jgi:hypothetical protein
MSFKIVFENVKWWLTENFNKYYFSNTVCFQLSLRKNGICHSTIPHQTKVKKPETPKTINFCGKSEFYLVTSSLSGHGYVAACFLAMQI